MSTGAHDRQTTADDMDRVTTRYPKPLLARVEALVDADVYPNRSEALRDLIAAGLAAREGDDAGG